MAILKEFYAQTIGLVFKGDAPVGEVSVIRFDDGKPLNAERLSQLFNVAAKDFPKVASAKIRITDQGIEIAEAPPSAEYKRKPDARIGFQG